MTRPIASARRARAVLLLAIAVSACVGPAAAPPVAEGVRAINGTELYVKRVGRGNPIVVVHGGPVLEHGYLEPALRPLAASHELIFYDQRLSGRSGGQVDSSSVRLATFVDDIEALRVALGLESVTLMGHSWGGLLAMEYAIRYGEHLTALILLDPMPPTSALWQEEEAILATRITLQDSIDMAELRATEGFANREPAAVEQALLISFRPQFHDRSRMAGLHFSIPRDYGERSRQFGYMMEDLMSFDVLDDLARVTVPTLVVYGADEPARDLSGPMLVEGMARATLAVIDDAGHFPFVEQPEAFLEVVRAFLEKTGQVTTSDLQLAAPISSWDEALPLGNGLPGGHQSACHLHPTPARRGSRLGRRRAMLHAAARDGRGIRLVWRPRGDGVFQRGGAGRAVPAALALRRALTRRGLGYGYLHVVLLLYTAV